MQCVNVLLGCRVLVLVLHESLPLRVLERSRFSGIKWGNPAKSSSG
jgi:hypothetical protein